MIDGGTTYNSSKSKVSLVIKVILFAAKQSSQSSIAYQKAIRTDLLTDWR